MRHNCLPAIILLSVCCCITKKSNKCIDNTNMNYPVDVVVIKDSFQISSDFSSPEKDYLVSKNYIGTIYVCNQDTIVETPVLGFPPNVMKEIHSYGKDVIPYLISQIDMDNYNVAGFVNPYDSNLENTVIGSPLGVNYAYMIELILGKDTIMDSIYFAEGYNVWNEKMKPYRLYRQCVIIRKKDQNNPKNSKISFDDMKSIKSIYFNWWNNNKDENLDFLRKKWKEEGSPLQKSPYMWI